MYGTLGAPAISCMLAPDGITKKRLIEGYRYDLALNDRLYINSDDNTMALNDTDIIIFATKVSKNTYEYILKPLNLESRKRGRHLIVAAPSYDEMALQQVIAVDLNNEYRQRHDVNLVLTTYRAISAHTRKLINDFAILTNTMVIDRALETAIIDKVASGIPIFQVINIDGRDIPNLKCIATDGEHVATFIKGEDELPEGYTTINEAFPLDENSIDLGYVKRCSLGLKTSHFTDLVYDENRYRAVLAEAKSDLEEKEKKYQKLGTFNIEVSQAQDRLYALNLKMGIIEVGGDTELSQKLSKDAVDDAVRAAASAFNHGVIHGCNTDLILSIKELYNEESDPVNKILIKILEKGFIDVYKTVISNAFEDERVKDANSLYNWFIDRGIEFDDVFDSTVVKYVIDDMLEDEDTKKNGISIHEFIINCSLRTNTVFDISKFRYSSDVINSAQTDEEVLKATIDLISLLISGNQMVITQKHNFE